jgi:4-amino-4-deoxy-L-arabinose transferase-like glycosyltransferase
MMSEEKESCKMKLLENKKLLLATIFVAALLVRFSTMVILETYRFPTDAMFGFGYGETARQVALGEGFSLGYFDSGEPRPTAVAPPGYVYFLALIFSIFGIYSVESAIIIEIFQSVFAALTCLVFYHLGKKFNATVGLLAALGMAFYPPSILFSVMRISPILLMVLLLGIIILYLFKIQEQWRYRDALTCGILMGITALLEPVVILFYIASSVWLFFWSTSRLRAVKCSLIMGSVCIALILPWTIRNYFVFDAFVPVKSSMGRHLLEGNHPFGDGVVFADEFTKVFSEPERKRLRNLSEIEEDKIFQKKAIEYIKADPGRFIQTTVKRIYYYWSFANPHRPTSHDKLRMVTYGPVFILAMIGLLLVRRNWREGSLFLTLFLSYPLFYYVTQVTINRYRYGAEAFLIIMASYAAVELINSFRRSPSVVPLGQRRAVD